MRSILTSMNEYQLGNKQSALKHLKEGKRILGEEAPPPTDRVRQWWSWRSKVLHDTLLQEATTLTENGRRRRRPFSSADEAR
jgi:hypothetical protein